MPKLPAQFRTNLAGTAGLAVALLATGCATRGPIEPPTAAAPSAPPAAQAAAPKQARPEPNVTVEVEPTATPEESTMAALAALAEEARAERPTSPTAELRFDDPLPEHYLYGERLGELMVPATVVELPMAEPGEDQYPQVFDLVGEQAKSEYVRGSVMGQKGYGTKAVESFVEAARRDPDNTWLKYRAALAVLSQNDLPRATKLAEEILAQDPQNVRAMILMATISSYRDDADNAKAWYKKALEVQPKNMQALESLAHLAYSRDKDMEATKEYAGRILQITSRNLNAMLWHAEANALTGNVEEAALLYGQLMRYRPSLVSRLSDMATRLKRQGDAKGALYLLKRGVAMAPDVEPLRLQWEVSMLEASAGQTGAIDAGYRELCDEHPLDLRIQELYAELLERQDRRADLRAQRDRMLKVDPHHIQSLLSLARLDLAEGNPEQANVHFELAIAAGPDQASTYRDIAMVYLDQGNTERAGQLLAEAALLDPEDAETLVAMASLSESDDDLTRAESLLKRAVDVSPANEALLRELGEFYRRHDRLVEASQIYENILAISPRDSRNMLALAILYFETDNTRALDHIQEQANKQLEDPTDFMEQFGRLAYEYGDWPRARWALEKFVKETPAEPAIRMLLASSLVRLGDKKVAEEIALGTLAYLDKSKPEVEPLYLYSFYSDAGDWAKAEKQARALLDIEGKTLDSYRRLTEVLIEAGKLDDATEVVNEAFRAYGAKDGKGAKMLRADLLKGKGELSRAIGVLEPLANEFPDDIEVRFALAIAYAEARDISRARDAYTRVGELAGEDPANAGFRINALNNLAYLYSQEGIELDHAEELASEALRLNPRAGYILDTLGWINYQQKDYPEAERLLRQAERMSHQDAEVLMHLGDLFRETGRQALALEYYERAADIDPELAGVRDKIDAARVAAREASPTPATP